MDKKLLEIIVCPVTKGPLIYDKENQELISKSARLAYPIRNNIPIMLEEEARQIREEEMEKEWSWWPRRHINGCIDVYKAHAPRCKEEE